MTRAESALSLRGALALTVTAFGLNWAWEAAQCRPFFVHPLPCPGSLAMIASAIGDVVMTWIAFGLIAIASRDWRWIVHPWRRRQWAAMIVLAIVMSVGLERWALAAGRWSYTAANPLVPGVGVSAIPVLQLLLFFPLTFAVAAAATRGRAPNDSSHTRLDTARPVVTGEARLRRYAWWFIHMRWVVTGLATATIVTAIKVARLLPDEVFRPLLLTLAALAAFNWAYGALLRAGWRVGPILTFQVYADLVFLTVLLHFSGGMENPVGLLACLTVILGGIVLSRARCFLLALTASGLLGLLAWAEWAHAIAHYTMRMSPHGHAETIHAAYDTVWTASWTGLHVIVCVLIAHFVSRLADESRAHERGLLAAADEARAQQELLEQALENTGTGLRVLDRGLRLLWVNDQWRRWFPAVSAKLAAFLAWAAAEGSDARATLADGEVRLSEYTDPAVTLEGAPNAPSW